MNAQDLTGLSTRIPFKLRQEFKSFCAKQGLNMQQGATQAIAFWLNSQKQGGEAA